MNKNGNIFLKTNTPKTPYNKSRGDCFDIQSISNIKKLVMAGTNKRENKHPANKRSRVVSFYGNSSQAV